eukprot:CAMPEP_0184551960 /NCGR_PEP_ID=MMETSP0199_2-20130426/27246_1 /TAXON_ID=1112570 /ORGANISM="Thraustochytrium sp., Strain LLF1b" /LENGTH=756 /DNA_ID=CAMNT_0026947305 /DNA_START=20 /DNA_END=2290 /DNA_ORIENTATION=+
MDSASNRYFRVDKLTKEEEAASEAAGGNVRNYGRLKKSIMEGLCNQELKDENPREMLKRKRPWRLERFIKDLINTRGSTFGEASHQGYTVRVLDGGVANVLGKGLKQVSKPAAEAQEAVVDFAPWDRTDVYWETFELWRELLGSSLINCMPDRPFSLYVYAKDVMGDDTPVFYMELQVKDAVERHSVVWEMDQVITSSRRISRHNEGSKASEYASAYQKVYFFLNWDEGRARRVDRMVLCDLAKDEKLAWDSYLSELHIVKSMDALIAILITISSLVLSVCNDSLEISLVAGIIVAGIASEEWLSPQTVFLGAIARLFGNESLALRLYYRTINAQSTRRVLISVLGSIGELASLGGDASLDKKCYVNDHFSLNAFMDKLSETPNFIVFIASAVNVFCLFHTALGIIYDGFSSSDFPDTFLRHAKCYVPKKGYMRQVMDDLKPIEEYCSVYRPLLHWRRGVANRFLGQDIDLASPGSPPSMVCYWMTFPASSKMCVAIIYGKGFRWGYLPLAIVEQVLALVGSVIMIVNDLLVAILLAVTLLLKKSRLLNRSAVRGLVASAMGFYAPAGAYASLVDTYNLTIAKCLGLETLNCRGRTTAPLYRLPSVQRVRTGQSSNHSWKFGDWAAQAMYYRCHDMVIMNPRISKLGMIEARKLVYKRHKLMWNSFGGVRYSTPILGCGDNIVARRTSITGNPEDKKKRYHIPTRVLSGTVDDSETTEEYGFKLPRDVISPDVRVEFVTSSMHLNASELTDEEDSD